MHENTMSLLPSHFLSLGCIAFCMIMIRTILYNDDSILSILAYVVMLATLLSHNNKQVYIVITMFCFLPWVGSLCVCQARQAVFCRGGGGGGGGGIPNKNEIKL